MIVKPWEIAPELPDGRLSAAGSRRTFLTVGSARRLQRRLERARRDAHLNGFRWVIVDRRKDFGL